MFITELNHNHHKRPARLLPFQLLYGTDKKNQTNNQQIKRFYGPPTNCSDLTKLGYTLNGFYVVRPINYGSNIEAKLETIFCAFKQPEGTFNSSNVEKRIAFLNLDRSDGIHFHVSNQKSSDKGFRNQDVLKFDVISLNLGTAFDATKGVFTAPKSGVYQFIFKGSIRVIKSKQKFGFLIELFHNENVIGNSIIAEEDQVTMIEATLKVNRGDRIFLKTSIGDGILMNGGSSTSFSGSLLEELL